MKKLITPIHALKVCTRGLSKTAPALPILCRKDMRLKLMKKNAERTSAMTMAKLVNIVGAERRLDTDEGRNEMSAECIS
jgi:hypothetical protein